MVELLERKGASNPATSLTAYESESEIELFVSNETPLKNVSDSSYFPSESISFVLKKSKRITDKFDIAIKKERFFRHTNSMCDANGKNFKANPVI